MQSLGAEASKANLKPIRAALGNALRSRSASRGDFLSPVAQPTPPPATIGVSVRSESPALPRKEEPVLAGFELTPTAPLDEHQRQRDQEARRSYRVNGAA